MNIVRFQGGFANQLFQLCLYEKLTELYGREKVFADVSHFRTNNDHGGFKLRELYELRYIDELPQKYIIINENNYSSTEICEDSDYYYFGYWQSEFFFPENIDFIYGLFNESLVDEANAKLIMLMGSTQSVSIHIRRGDYINNDFHGNIANQAYINNAISYIKDRVNDPVFFVFSDDISWCKANLKFVEGSEVYFITGNQNHVELDMFMMSKCKNNIIANSSFSWWAQRLNKHEDKVVISPEYWFNEEGSYCVPDQDGFVFVKNIPYAVKREAKPDLSVLLSVGVNEMHLRHFLANALNQTEINVELLSINKVSSRHMIEVLKDYAKANSYIKTVNTRGILAEFNGFMSALKKSEGEYILIADCDNSYPKEFWKNVEAQINGPRTGEKVNWLFTSERKGKFWIILRFMIVRSIKTVLMNARRMKGKVVRRIKMAFGI